MLIEGMSSAFRDLVRVDVGGNAGEVVADELVGPLELGDDLGLPGQKVGGDHLLEALPLELVAGIEDAVARRKLIETSDVLPPIIQSPGFVQGLAVLNFFLSSSPKHLLDGFVGRARGMSLVVQLVADDGGMAA